MPEWLIPLIIAVVGSGGIGAIVMNYYNGKKAKAETSKVYSEAAALAIANEYAPGEKLVSLAERAADLVTTKYEKVMERQDETIERQNIKINGLEEEIKALSTKIEEAKKWHVELDKTRLKLEKLKKYVLESGLELPKELQE